MRTHPTPVAQSLRTSHRWLVLLPDGLEIERRYQWPADLARVLSEHRAALAAIPIDDGYRDSAGTAGSPP